MIGSPQITKTPSPPARYVPPQIAPDKQVPCVNTRLKITFFGNSGAGKTKCWRLITGHRDLDSDPQPTAALEWHEIRILTESGDCLAFWVWDTSGQERYNAMAPQYYRNMHGGFGVFDMNEAAHGLRLAMESEEYAQAPTDTIADRYVRAMMEKMTRGTLTTGRTTAGLQFSGFDTPIVAYLANKCDLDNDLECVALIRSAIRRRIDSSRERLFETSARDGSGVGEAFSWLVENCYARIKSHVSSHGYPDGTKPGALDHLDATNTTTAIRYSGGPIEEADADRQRRLSAMFLVPESRSNGPSVYRYDPDAPEVYTCAC